jgi:hypothetical protein
MPIGETKKKKLPKKCPGNCKGTGTVYDKKNNIMKDCPDCQGKRRLGELGLK